MQTLSVALGERSYPIHVGAGLLDRAGLIVPFLAQKKAAVVTNPTVAAFYLDRGVRHTRRVTRHLRNGQKKRVTVVSFRANATVRHLPASVGLRVAGLRSGTHTLKVVLTYSKQVTRHHHRATVKVTKTLKVKFRVC